MKTIIKIFLSFVIAISPIFIINSANAATFGGWSIGGLVADGASAIAQGTKQVIIDGKNYLKKGTAKITPTASQVSKVLARGAAGYALSVAVQQLIGAVDWVLDPANNQIIYTDPNAPIDPDSPALQYYYVYTLWGANKKVSSINEACILAFKAGGWAGPNIPPLPSGYGCSLSGNSIKAYSPSGSFGQIGYRVANPAYDPAAEDERKKTLPLDVVAQQVISNAEARDPNAQVATTAAAQDIINDAQQDETKARPIVQQLEASASTENADSSAQQAANEATGQSQPNTANPQATDIKLNFPVFCGWAPLVCEAAQVVISFPQTLTGWYMETKTKAEQWASSIADAYHDFMKNDELPAEDTKVDIAEIPTPELQENAISWGASCPADVSIPISMQGVSSTLVFSWSPWCQLLSIIKPAIVASAYIGAAFIVLGLRT